jgi:hypothetical protein
MSEANPPGTVFVVLIGELLDLVRNPDIAKISVVIGSYELDHKGANKMVNGKASVALRSFEIGGMNEEVQEKLRAEIEAGPIGHLMVLWIDRFKGLGFARFDPVTDRKSASMSDLDNVEKSMIADYLQRLKPK